MTVYQTGEYRQSGGSWQTGLPELDKPIVRLLVHRTLAELDVLSSALSDPGRAMPLLDAAGVTKGWFDSDDAACIYVALNVGRDRGKVNVLKYARFLLKHEHLWDATQTAGNVGASILYSDESLVALACRYPFCTANVRARVTALRSIIIQQQTAEDLLKRLCVALEPDPTLPSHDLRPRDEIVAPESEPLIVNAPVRRRNRGAA